MSVDLALRRHGCGQAPGHGGLRTRNGWSRWNHAGVPLQSCRLPTVATWGHWPFRWGPS